MWRQGARGGGTGISKTKVDKYSAHTSTQTIWRIRRNGGNKEKKEQKEGKQEKEEEKLEEKENKSPCSTINPNTPATEPDIAAIKVEIFEVSVCFT